MYRIWMISWIFLTVVLARRRSLQTKTLPEAQRQLPNCNNCYAVVAYDILKYHRPKLNVSVSSLMQDSHQNCAGGSVTKIWDLFLKSSITTANLPKLIRLLRKGPVAIASEKGISSRRSQRPSMASSFETHVMQVRRFCNIVAFLITLLT